MYVKNLKGIANTNKSLTTILTLYFDDIVLGIVFKLLSKNKP